MTGIFVAVLLVVILDPQARNAWGNVSAVVLTVVGRILAHAALAESCADLARVDRDEAVALRIRCVDAQRVRRAAAPHSASRLRALARSLTELGKVVSNDLAARALWTEARIPTRERHDAELLAWLDNKLGPEDA